MPNQDEVNELMKINDFEIIDTFYRSDKFNESVEVKSKSGECRFWIAKKR